jgi:hypothetical protein
MALFYRVRGVHTNRDPCLPDEPFLTSNLGTVRNDGVDGSDRRRSGYFCSDCRRIPCLATNRRDVITNLLIWISGILKKSS